MRSFVMTATLALLCLVPGARAAEVWVDGSAAAGGDGSAAKPYATIGAAIKAAKGGDTISIRKGTYHESLQMAVSGTAAQPTILRAAPGERVILSGFAPLKDWKAEANGIYTAMTDAEPEALFVGYNPQPVSRWPDFDEPMRTVKDPKSDENGVVFNDSDPAGLAGEPALKAVAGDLKSAMAFLYVSGGNAYSTQPVKAIDLAAGAVTLAPMRWASNIKGKGDRYQIVNHPALIRKPGEWAFEKLGEKAYRVYFKPASPADLERAQYRQGRSLLAIGRYNGSVSYIRVEGLELCGSGRNAVEVNGSDHIAVARCIAHHNQGAGLHVRRSGQVQFVSNISLANSTGISVTSSHEVLVEGNEVAQNEVDGIDVAGNVTGRAGGEPETDGVILRRNYFHHHMLLSHPDNMQTYRGVKNLALDGVLALWGGQNLMTEETEGASIRNCALLGTGAYVVIFGHGNSHDWTVKNSTIGLGGWGLFQFSGHGYRLQDNIWFNNEIGLGPQVTSDYNVLWNTDPAQAVALTSKPKWQRFTDVAQAAEVTGQEKHSKRVDPQFRNAPAVQAVAPWADANRPGLLAEIRGGAATTARFAKGDQIEINGDGVLRRVTAVTEDTIAFEPPLPCRPFRDSLIWNWKDARSAALDLRPREQSPALGAGERGKPAGSTIDVQAYQRGDFDGDGKRDIPELPEDVKVSIPNPNAIVVPLHGA